jgi:hypothetical protein
MQLRFLIASVLACLRFDEADQLPIDHLMAAP